MRRFFIVFVGMQIFLTSPALISAAGNKQSYLERIERRTVEWQKALPEIKKSAGAAADKIMAGGNLYVTGPQESFKLEPVDRAGGMLLARQYAENTVLSDKDIILAASIDETLTDTFLTLVNKAAAAKCQIILFSASLHQPLPKAGCITFLPGRKFSLTPDIYPVNIESVSNIIGMWTWTAEFTAACVRQGKMPCFFESVLVPGGLDLYKMLKQSSLSFYAYSNVTPADVKNLGRRYLQSVTDSLAKIRGDNDQAFRKGADFIRDCHASGHNVWVNYIGHMFPGEFDAKQNPAWFTPATIAPENKSAPEDVIIILGYQEFPWIRTADISKNGNYCILTCSHKPPAEFTRNIKNSYINPFWEMTDAAVSINNYDAKILPVSGVMQATIYWQLVEMSL